MSSLDGTIPPLALKLINKFGTSITLTVNSTGTYDPATSKATSVPVVQSIMGLIEEYADNLRFLGDKLGLGSSIVDGDKKITIASQGLTAIPKAGDGVDVGTQGFIITGVGSMWSGQLVAAYVLHVSKR